MATNFELLTINEFPGMGYRNCTLNQLWQFESIITGNILFIFIIYVFTDFEKKAIFE